MLMGVTMLAVHPLESQMSGIVEYWSTSQVLRDVTCPYDCKQTPRNTMPCDSEGGMEVITVGSL